MAMLLDPQAKVENALPLINGLKTVLDKTQGITKVVWSDEAYGA